MRDPGSHPPVFLTTTGSRLTRAEFDAVVVGLAQRIRTAGAGPADVIAIVMPNGPNLALAVLAAMRAGIAAPLNPALTAAEIGLQLEDLRPGLVIGADDDARFAPGGRLAGLPILRLGDADVFAAPPAARPLPAPGPGQVALLLSTSGTTSRPKLVPLTHENLRHSTGAVVESLGLTEADRCLSMMPFFHVHGIVAGLLAPLESGGSLVATSGLNPLDVPGWLTGLAPSWYTGVPAVHRAMLASLPADGIAEHSLRFIRSSSSPLPPSLMAELESTFGVPVLEAYGMTEGAHQIAINPAPPGTRKPGTVGRATGCEVAVLVDGKVRAAPGGPGEVVIKGPNLTAGYRDNPEANQSAFIDGWFRTGDLGVLDADGYLTLVGRLKEMINRGGEKIAPREVDEALLQHPAVAQAVAFPYPHRTLGEDVAAAVVLRPGAEVTAAVLTGFAGTLLAPYKVPRRLLIVDRIPAGPTGKPQRSRLAAELGLGSAGVATVVAAPGASAGPLAQTWAEVLQLESVPPDEDFFSFGGDSLRAVTLLARVREQFGADISLAFFLDGAASLARMEAMLDAAPRVDGNRTASAGPADPTEGDTPSFAEQRVLFLSGLEPSGALYNVPLALRLGGPLDRARLGQALDLVAARHEGFRTEFPQRDGRWTRRVLDHHGSALPLTPTTEADLPTLLADEARRPFDLERGPLVRRHLYRLAPEDHVVLLTMHHSVIDGSSQEIVFRDLAAAYRDPTLPGAPQGSVSLSAVARLERSRVASGVLDTQRDYWIRRLTPLPAPLDLPVDRRFIDGHRWEAGRLHLDFDEALTGQLRGLARAHRATLFMTLLAGLAGLLHRVTGSGDVVVGAPAANRLSPGTEGLVGMLTNTLALRMDVSGNPTFAQLIARARETSLGALANQEYPFDRVVSELAPARDLGLSPLFRVMFQARRGVLDGIEFPGLVATDVEVDVGVAKFDLNIEVVEEAAGLRGIVTYNRHLFDASTVATMCRRWELLLREACVSPGLPLASLPILEPDEVEWLLQAGTGPAPPPRETNPLELVAEQAALTPAGVAVEAGASSLTYAQLMMAAQSLAGRLQEAGVVPGHIVGVSVARTEGMVVAMLAILMCGAAYCPLDPAYPRARRQTMAAAVGLRFMVDDEFGRDAYPGVRSLPLDGPPGPPLIPVKIDPGQPAYVLFTSGSTGLPRATVVHHRGVANLLRWARRTFSAAEASRVLVGTSLNFDFSVLQVFMPLVVGGTAVIVDNVLAMRDVGDTAGITMLSSVPAAIEMLLDAGAIPASVLVVCVGGETLNEPLARRLLELPTRPRVLNLYGPTETTVIVTSAEITAVTGSPPIGRPIDGTTLAVLDSNGSLVAPGLPGELYIGGASVGLGYLNDPDRTARRFVEVELPGVGWTRMYRTGDRVRLGHDGQFQFLGRLDDQLKVRGMRIEPGEVEAALREHPGITGAAVLGNVPTSPSEVHAWVTADRDVDETELREFVGSRLPRHMVPRKVTRIDVLPLNANGKVDRRALSQLAPQVAASAVPPASPADAEGELLAIWRRLLPGTEIRPDTDFFDLGGHSLLAVHMITEVERRTGVRIPLGNMFAGGATIRTLARMVAASRAGRQREGARETLVVPVQAGDGEPPLFFIHADATGVLSTRNMVGAFGAARPVYALAPRWDRVQSLEPLVDELAATISAISPGGMVHLAGHSIGGLVAYEVGGRLQGSGVRLGMVCLVDSPHPVALGNPRGPRLQERARGRLRRASRRVAGVTEPAAPPPPASDEPVDLGPYGFDFDLARRLAVGYQVTVLDHPVTVLVTGIGKALFGPDLGWRRHHPAVLRTASVPGDHVGVLREPHVAALAEVLTANMRASDAR